ncbi:hypothetical protein HPB50_029592 [Hyalomma asiaticum]|nr:hypothetical protein HPB50_029592 [Hyalomma asiaticum]
MTYLDLLCSHLSRMPLETLWHLDDEPALHLPKVRGNPKTTAIDMIYESLKNTCSHSKHLANVARVYCFVAEQDFLQPWMLYSLGRRENHVAHALGVLNTVLPGKVGCHTKATTSYWCTCLVATDEVGWMVCTPGIFCVWPSFAYVAVHEPSPGHAPFVTRMLEQMLGEEPDSFHCGIYQGMNDARAAARRLSLLRGSNNCV